MTAINTQQQHFYIKPKINNAQTLKRLMCECEYIEKNLPFSKLARTTNSGQKLLFWRAQRKYNFAPKIKIFNSIKK